MSKTAEQLVPYLHLIEAVRDGKTIQIQRKSCEWINLNPKQVLFTDPPEKYRVKPGYIVCNEHMRYGGASGVFFGSRAKGCNVRFTIDPDTQEIVDAQLIKD